MKAKLELVYGPPKHVIPTIKFRWGIAILFKALLILAAIVLKNGLKVKPLTSGIWKEVEVNIVTSEIKNEVEIVIVAFGNK
jgi:hypothetical protein